MKLIPFKPRELPQAAIALRALHALKKAGYETLFAGGAVRDSLLGRHPQDFDLATVALPEQVMTVLRMEGFRFVLTGIEHGTVMAIAEREKVEITTLRRDVETDGRRARVAFTDNWAQDAARRDLTINALYADEEGAVLDLTEGLADLAQQIVRFVGDPAARVAEDALRILRFFRFHAAYGAGPCEPKGLAACIAARETLAQLSGERIWSEVQRLLIAPRAGEVLDVMCKSGIFEFILPLAAPEDRHFDVLADLERQLAKPDPVRRLALLLDFASSPETKSGMPMAGQKITGAEAVAPVARRLKLSRTVTQRLERILVPPPPILTTEGLKRLLHHHGFDVCLDWLLLGTVQAGQNKIADDLWAFFKSWHPKPFPLTGDDLLAAGLQPGAVLGRLLMDLEEWWLTQDRMPDRAACLKRLQSLQKN